MLLMKLPKWSMFNYRTQLNEFTYIVYICIMFFHWFFPHKFPPQTACSFCNLQVQVPSCRNLLPPHWPPHRDPWPSACCFPPRRTWPALAMWKTWTQKNVFCLCGQKSIPPNLFSHFFCWQECCCKPYSGKTMPNTVKDVMRALQTFPY